MKENKSICINYLNMINKEIGLNLRLTSYNNYYVIENELNSGGMHKVYGGASLKECKSYAVGAFELLQIMKGVK